MKKLMLSMVLVISFGCQLKHDKKEQKHEANIGQTRMMDKEKPTTRP